MTDEAATSNTETVLGHPTALFGAAVLHVIVAVKQGNWRFLFGYVELLPREMSPPPHDGLIIGPHLRRSGFRVFADHLPITADQGIQWYLDARDGRVVRPGEDGSLPSASDAGAVICDPEDRDQEPVWPGFISAASAEVLPFLSRWHRTPRTHHLLETSRALPFQADELAQLDEFFEREAGFRRSAFPQLFGSAHLVVPNPYYRELHELLDEGTNSSSVVGNGHESINVHVDVRSKVSLPSMSVNIVDHRPVGIGRSVTSSLTSSPTNVPMGIAVRRTSVTVRLNADDSIVETRAPTPFIREFQLTMDVTGSRRSVNVMDSSGTVVETYAVSVGHPHTSQGGIRPPSAAADALEVMLNEIAVRNSAKELDQRWFAGNSVTARDFVRDRIRRARDQVLIADPYLSGLEVQRFALATTVARVAVRMLTTRDGFPPTGLTPAALARNLARWQAEESSLGKLEIRVLDRDELHDRFLRVDDRVYSLGNSLNSIGDKASLLIRVPDPTPVILELEKLWNVATPLEDFARTSASGGCP